MMKIKKLRLYLETTVFNYFFDAYRDGHDDTVRLFEAIGTGQYEGYISVHVSDELKKAQEPKRTNMLNLVDEYGIKFLQDEAQVLVLSKLYIENGIIPVKYRLDSLHVAMASVYDLDCVISYNFEHINLEKTKMLASQVNRGLGYNGVVICTAKEVLDDDVQFV